jgi:hypothetical protein
MDPFANVSTSHQAARQIAGFLGQHQYRFTLSGQPVMPEQAVDAVIIQGQKVRGLSPDGQSNEFLASPDRLRFFLARQAGMHGLPEAEIHRLVEGPLDDSRQLDKFEQLAGTGVKYRTEKGNDIPSSPGLLPYLAERSGRNLKIFVPGASEGRPVQSGMQLQAVLRVLGLAGGDPFDAQRQANVQTLLDHGFRFRGAGHFGAAQDVCLAQSGGENVLFSMPNSAVEHKLPTCPNWDADGMVQLADVRERGRLLTQGDTPLLPGSSDIYHAQQIAGEYTEKTLEGYLRTMGGNPDPASTDSAKNALREQVGLMSQRLDSLESSARREALDEMDVQTRFLQSALGSGSSFSLGLGGPRTGGR